MKHTKGKWEVTASISGFGEKHYYIISQTTHLAYIEQNKNTKANAQLIATAPELLEVCRKNRDLLNELQMLPMSDDIRSTIYCMLDDNERIIGKAQGEGEV